MKTNQNHQRIAAAFERLFRTYGPLGQGSTPEEVARDRIERIKVYFDAVALYEERDVEEAVENFLNGSAPGVSNFSFAPPAPVVGAEVRRVMNLRLDHEARIRKPALPPPDIEKTDESRERVRLLAAQAIDKLASDLRTDDAAKTADRKKWQDRMDRRFTPAQDESALRQRLGFEVGDRDGHEDAA
jgi:hypothetical protein